MSEALLTTYNSLQTSSGSDFSIKIPEPFKYGYTKIKRWWNKTAPSTIYESCAVLEIKDSFIIVSGQSSLRLKIVLVEGELQFFTNGDLPGRGNVERILVCPKNEINNLVNYDDYYYDYTERLLKKLTYGNGGLETEARNDFVEVESGGILLTQEGGFVLAETQVKTKGIVREDLVLHLDASDSRSYDAQSAPTKWKDISVRNSTKIGTINRTNQVLYVDRHEGYFQFEGNGYIEFESNEDLRLDKGDWTIAYFFRINQAKGTLIDFRSRANGTADGFSDYLTENGNNIKINSYSNYDGTWYVSDFTLVTGSWYHICFTKKGNTIKVYKNGELKDTLVSDDLAELNFRSDVLRVGANYTGNASKSGIGEVLIYKGKALTSDEVKQNHDACMPRFAT